MPAAASASRARATAASLRSMPTIRSGRSSRWRPRSVRSRMSSSHVHEPAAVVAAGEDDEARLVGERLAVEDARDDRVGVGEVAPVRDRARAQVHLVLDVPLAGVVVAGRVGGGQLAAVEVGQPGEHRQVGADEAEVGDEVQAVAAGLGPGAVLVDPAERGQQAAGLLAAVAGRAAAGRRRRPAEAAGGVEPEQDGGGERAVELRGDLVAQRRARGRRAPSARRPRRRARRGAPPARPPTARVQAPGSLSVNVAR